MSFGRARAQTHTIAFVSPAPSQGNAPQYPHDGPWVNGLDFKVVAPTTIYSLGAFDSLQDGVYFKPVTVTIFNATTGLKVTPEVVFSTDDPGTLMGGSRFKSIPSVTLNPGTYSVVAAYYGWDQGSGEPFIDVWWGNGGGVPVFYDGSGGPAADQRTGYRFDVGTTLRLPTDAGWSFPVPVFGCGTFEFDGKLANKINPMFHNPLYLASHGMAHIPEPTAGASIASLALLGFVAVRRGLRRSRRSSPATPG